MAKSVSFFADSADLKQLIEVVESRQKVHYYEAGRFDTNNIPHFTSLLDIPDLGIAGYGIKGLNKYYLVLPFDISLILREVAQHAGGTAFFVDQLYNSNSILFRPGGLWQGTAIIPSIVDTLSDDGEAKAIIHEFAKGVRKFKRIKSVAVGNNALFRLEQGLRFTDDVRSPTEYDLKL
jgi:hypothetical protein